VRLATRGSALARIQAGIGAEALRAAGAADVTELIVRTASDRQPDVPLERLEGQGWFLAGPERVQPPMHDRCL